MMLKKRQPRHEDTKTHLPPMLQLAFRPFFLLSACYCIWLLINWSLTLSGYVAWSNDAYLMAWHAHEFQFGYALLVVLGFLLTAAQTWTKQPSASGITLLLLIAFWLASRLAMNLNFHSLTISLIADSALIILSGAILFKMIIKAKNYKNLVFLPILAVFLMLHVLHIDATSKNNIAFGTTISYSTSWWYVLLISLISSRVIPLFIANATSSQIHKEPIYFTVIAQLLIVLIFLQTLFNVDYAKYWLIGFSFPLHCYRLYIWYDRGIWKNPMLWSLFLSYSFLPCALLSVLLMDSYANAMHLINIGFISSMILAFTTRVSLGHTARPIKATFPITLSLALIIASALIRVYGPTLYNEWYVQFMSLSAICWLIALVCFLYTFVPILIRPRLDGQPG